MLGSLFSIIRWINDVIWLGQRGPAASCSSQWQADLLTNEVPGLFPWFSIGLGGLWWHCVSITDRTQSSFSPSIITTRGCSHLSIKRPNIVLFTESILSPTPCWTSLKLISIKGFELFQNVLVLTNPNLTKKFELLITSKVFHNEESFWVVGWSELSLAKP